MRPSRYITDAARVASLFPSRSLRRLVALHRGSCEEMGLDPLALEQADDNVVLGWLRENAVLLPSSLAEDLDRIDDLTDERGAAALLAVGTEAGVDLRGLGHDPIAVAAAAFLDHRALFERAYGRRTLEKFRSTAEFAGRVAVAPRALELAEIKRLEARLGSQFEARDRSPHCEVTVGRDGDRLVFTVGHGALVRSDEALDDLPMVVRDSAVPVYLPGRALRYRPHRRDVVVYDGRDGSLRIRASDAPTLRAYRQGFGELLHGDPDWFGDGPVVSLEPLLHSGAAVEVPTAGLRAVRLVGLIVHYDTGLRGTVALDSEELWPFLDQRLNGTLRDGELVEAIFRVYAVGRLPARIKVRVPNGVDYGCVDEEVVRPWLEARGFLASARARMTG